MNPVKLTLARAFDVTGLNRGLLALQGRLLRPHVRAVNYHDVPPSRAGAFENQLRFYAEHFVAVGRREILQLLEGHWPHPKPGILLSFDDGLRSHAEVVAPLLERHGFPGWFLVPSDFPDVPVERQATFAAEHHIHCAPEYGDGRCAVTWQQLRALDARHVVGCHTASHRRLRADLDAATLEREICGAKARLEAMLGHEVDVFAWVGGEEESYSPEAARVMRAAGFRIGLMTNNLPIRPDSDPLQLQRTNVEASDPDPIFRFQLSGFLDVTYLPKRRRVNRLTAAG